MLSRTLYSKGMAYRVYRDLVQLKRIDSLQATNSVLCVEDFEAILYYILVSVERRRERIKIRKKYDRHGVGRC